MKRDSFDPRQNAELASETPQWIGRIDSAELERAKKELGLSADVRILVTPNLTSGTDPILVEKGVPDTNPWGLSAVGEVHEHTQTLKRWDVWAQAPIGLRMANDILIHEMHHGALAEKYLRAVYEARDDAEEMMRLWYKETQVDQANQERECHALSERLFDQFHIAVPGLPNKTDADYGIAVTLKEGQVDYMAQYKRDAEQVKAGTMAWSTKDRPE